MKLVLGIVLVKILMTTASSNDVVVCKYADIPYEDDEKCSTNIIVNDETPVKTENKGEKNSLFN